MLVFMFGLFFDLEDRGNVFLQNVSWLSMDYKALRPNAHIFYFK
jgi:hypothetical protein